MINRRAIVASIAVIALGIAGCGGSGGGKTASTAGPTPEVNPAGDIPDNQAFVSYSPAAGGYAVKVPEGWARSTATDSAKFTDKLNTVAVMSVSGSSAPSVAETRKSDVAALKVAEPGFRLTSISSVNLSAGKAVLLKYTTLSAPDPVTGKRRADAVERYTFFHNGKRLVLTLTGPKTADNVDPWKLVSNSVRWTP